MKHTSTLRNCIVMEKGDTSNTITFGEPQTVRVLVYFFNDDNFREYTFAPSDINNYSVGDTINPWIPKPLNTKLNP